MSRREQGEEKGKKVAVQPGLYWRCRQHGGEITKDYCFLSTPGHSGPPGGPQLLHFLKVAVSNYDTTIPVVAISEHSCIPQLGNTWISIVWHFSCMKSQLKGTLGLVCGLNDLFLVTGREVLTLFSWMTLHMLATSRLTVLALCPCLCLMAAFFVSVATCCYFGGSPQQHTIHVVVSHFHSFCWCLKLSWYQLKESKRCYSLPCLRVSDSDVPRTSAGESSLVRGYCLLQNRPGFY